MTAAAEVLFWVLFGLSLGVIWAFFAGQFLLVFLHLVLRRRALRREGAVLAAPLPPAAELPHVVVQLPVYNEGALVRRAVTAAATLAWPQDKLHIQVLDDSTDGSTAVASAVVGEFQDRGVDVELIHRDNRQEFKAGALREAMEREAHPFYAIFDADYVPPPDFLAKCMRPMLDDPKVGFVQGRFDYLNADANWLTRGQSMMLDAHLAVEQATRSWAGFFFPFNGTCGVWRRRAIEESGGWQGGTLAEDMELSYRVWRHGWAGRYLLSVTAPGELPTNLSTWIAQQRRWIRGSGQASRRFVGGLLSRLTGGTGRMSLSALWHASAWWSVPALTAGVLSAVVLCLLNVAHLAPVAITFGATILGALLTPMAMQAAAARTLRPEMSWGQVIRNHLCFWLIGLTFPLVGIRTLIEGALDLGSSFERTPKRGT